MQAATIRRSSSVILVAAAAAVAAFLAPGWSVWATPFTMFCSSLLAFLVLAASVAIWFDSVPARRTLASAGLLAYLGIYLYWLLGTPEPSLPARDEGSVYTAVFSLLYLGGGIGLALKRRWGRWLAIAMAAGGLVASGLNLADLVLRPWGTLPRIFTFSLGFVYSLSFLFSLTLVALLWSRGLAQSDRHAADDDVWKSGDPLVRWTRAAVITGVIAGLMLCVFAWNQYGTAEVFRLPATALSAIVLLGAGLAARGKTAGVALLGAGALGLLALSIAIALDPPAGRARIAAYYHIFWLPAVLSGIGCSVRALLRVR